MNSFEVYVNWLALKAHFTQDNYDYFKYNGKVKASVDAFTARRDRLFFEKISKHKEPHRLMLANLIFNPKVFVNFIAYDIKAQEIYIEWEKKQQSLTHIVSQECSLVDRTYFQTNNGHPQLLKSFLKEEISKETFAVLVCLTGCDKIWLKKFPYDSVIEESCTFARKYHSFLQYDVKNMMSKIKEKMG